MSNDLTARGFTHIHELKPGHRLFQPLYNYLIILSALGHASSLMIGGKTHTEAKPQMRLQTQLGHAFILPLRGPLESALQNYPPAAIQIGVVALNEQSPQIVNPKLVTSGLINVSTQALAPQFLIFFERYNEWMTATHGDAVNWPSVLNFARVVRNAIAHGKINIRNQKAPAVAWQIFSYSYADNGRQIIGPDLSAGDIFSLMFDADKALDEIGAPVL